MDFEDLDKMADEGKLTEERFKEELNSYASALRQEFEMSTAAAPENTEQYTRDFFKKNIHSMAAQVVWLANNASSESVSLSACKFGILQALEDARSDGDPIKELLAELSKK
jgi:hypothetical protein